MKFCSTKPSGILEHKTQIRILGIPLWERRSSDVVPGVNIGDFSQLFGYDTSTGIQVNEENSLKLSAVWSCVKVLSETLAALPLNVYTRDANGNREIDKSNPLQFLLHRRPNSLMTSYSFRETLMLHKVLTGNGYAIIHRDTKGNAGELELVVWPKQVFVVKSKNDGRKYYGYQNKTYADYEMLHFMGLSLDGVTGVSPLKYARENMGTGLALQQFGNAFFKNGARMSGIVKVPGKVSDTTWEKIKNSWTNEYAGGDNVGKTAFLEAGMDYQPVSLSNEDAQYLSSRKFSIEEIARIYRVPLHMINSLDKATNNNIEHQGIEFVQHTMTPHIVAWEQEMDAKLIPFQDRDRKYIKFNMNALMRGDSASRAAYYKEMYYTGSMNSNEIRDNEEMNHYDGGDKYMIQANMIPADMAGLNILNKKETKDE